MVETVTEKNMDEEKAQAVIQIFKDRVGEPETPVADVPSRARFGELIRRSRNKANLSLRAVAEKVWESPAEDLSDHRHVWLGELERGKRPPDAELVDALGIHLEIDRDILMDAAQSWHRAIHSEGNFVLGDMDVKVTSLAPTAAQAMELRMEVERVIIDLESIRNDVEDFADQVEETVERAIARARATLDDFVTPFELDAGMMPEIILGSRWNPNPCPRCGGFGEDPDVERVEGISDWELRCEKCNGTGQFIPRFEVGRCYAHSKGELLRVMDERETTGHGMVMIAESTRRTDFVALGKHDGATLNYREVPLSEWFKHWFRSNPHDEGLASNAEDMIGREAIYPCRGQRVVSIKHGWKGVITSVETYPMPSQELVEKFIDVTFDDGNTSGQMSIDRFKLIEDDEEAED